MKTVRITTLLVVSILLTITSAVITHFAVRESSERVNIVLKTQEVIRASDAIFSQLKQTEIYYRDYILSHDSTLLKKFGETNRDIEDQLAHLQSQISDTAQIKLLQATVVPMVKEKISHLTASLKNVGTVTPHEEFNTLRQLHQYPDNLRESIARFNHQEEKLLASRMNILQKVLATQRVIRYICFVLIGITSLLALISLIKKQKQNDDLIVQLHITNATLEEKIGERTLELARKNQLTEKLNRDLQENFHTLELFFEALQVKNIKTEDTLREIKHLYDNANCGYHSLDPKGLIVRINQTELQWLGYQREEVVGKLSLGDILIAEEQAMFSTDFDQFVKDGFIRNKKNHYKRKDGTVFPVLINSSAIYDLQENFIMSRATVVDITEQEESEKKLIIFNERLKALNDEKDSFLGIAAHDLKSPLNGILGLINLLKHKTSNLTTEQQEYLRYIEQSCSNMKVMVTNLLDINRIEQGYGTLSLSHFSLRELLQQQLRMFQEPADRKNIKLVLDDSEKEIFMFSDPALVSRICDNLVSNAIKFSLPNGHVRLRPSLTEGHVTIEVEDQGPGIKKEEISLLFNKFKKLSARPTGGESSTGLGLSIVNELVHLLKGKILVDSEENVGTTFRAKIPLHSIP
jgi:PAS domain S-box-containing protein